MSNLKQILPEILDPVELSLVKWHSFKEGTNTSTLYAELILATHLHNCLRIVIMEGDPHPGAIKGRMSFQSFNPRIDRLNEEESGPRQTAAETSISRNQSVNVSTGENGAPFDGPGCAKPTSNEGNADLKRKQPEVMSETQCPNKSPRDDKGDCHSSHNNSLGSFKKPKGGKLDWNVLRPPKS